MKKYLFLFCGALLLSRIPSVNAQSLFYEKDTVIMQEDTVAILKDFSATYNSGTMYLRWIVSKQHADGIYIVLRSADKITYEPMGYKKGTGVPVFHDISYYFTDNAPLSDIGYYKIIHIGKNKTYLSSDVIAVDSRKKEEDPGIKALLKNKNEGILENTP